MSERERRAAFALAGVLVAAVVVVLALAWGARGGRQAERGRIEMPRAPQVAQDASRARPVARRRQSMRAKAGLDAPRLGNTHGARAQARRFVGAFVGVQRDGLDRTRRRELRKTASARVIAQLADVPPRGSGPAPRDTSLRLYRPEGNHVKASVLLAYKGGEKSLFEFLLRRSAGSWRVSELYP